MNYPEYKAFKRINEAKHSLHLDPTPSDILGPFYKAGAPQRNRFITINSLKLNGRVLNQQGQPITHATLDFWQANEQGEYDNTGFEFRGIQAVDSTNITPGSYELYTVKPGEYKISDENELEEFRCSHIHVIIEAPGFKRLTTQLYFPDSSHNKTDHWFDTNRVIGLTTNGRFGKFSFVLEEE